MKTIRKFLFGAMTMVSLASMAQTTSPWFTPDYNPERVNLDSSDMYSTHTVGQVMSPVEFQHYEVDEANNILRDTFFSPELKPQMVLEFEYNTENRLIAQTRKDWDDASAQWWISSIYEKEYDSRGNITKSVQNVRASIDDELIAKSKTETISDKNNNDSITIVYKWENNQWVITKGERIVYEYDRYGNFINEIKYSYMKGDWLYESTINTMYEYNSEGLILTQFSSGKRRIDYEYDSNNNIILKEEKVLNNDIWNWVDKLEQKFDANGLLVETITYKIVDNEPVQYAKFTNTYNESGSILMVNNQTWNIDLAKWTDCYRNEFVYDKYNRLVNYKEFKSVLADGSRGLGFEINWYYKIKIESLKVTDNKILTITFDSELAKNNFIAENIVVKSDVMIAGDLFVESANVSTSDSSSLVILFNREMVGGEKFTISLNEGLKTDNGRNVAFEVEMGNTATEVTDVEGDKVNIYPSIANDKITVSSSAEISQIQIYNVSGVEIAKTQTGSTNSIDVSVSELPVGLYKVFVTTANSSYTSTIIKQ